MDALTALVRELSCQFPSVPTATVRRHCGRAVQDVGASIPPLALPALLGRLVRLRLIAELLGDDLDLAALLCSANSLPELAQAVRAITCYRLGCAGVSLALVDDDQIFHADEDRIAPVWAGQRYPLTECLTSWALLHDQPVLINDIELDERVPDGAYRSVEVRSMLAVPISGPDGPVATIGAYWPVTWRPSPADLAWLQRLAEAVSGLIADIGLAGAPWAPNFRTRFRPPRR